MSKRIRGGRITPIPFFIQRTTSAESSMTMLAEVRGRSDTSIKIEIATPGHFFHLAGKIWSPSPREIVQDAIVDSEPATVPMDLPTYKRTQMFTRWFACLASST